LRSQLQLTFDQLQIHNQAENKILKLPLLTYNKNLAIANRSRISCANTTSRASMVTQWPWNLGYGSLKITGNGTIGYIVHSLLLVELFNVEYYRDLEMRVRCHSRSLKMVPFKRLGTVSNSHSIVTMAVSLTILEIFSVKEWSNLEIWVLGRSRLLKMVSFNRPYTEDDLKNSRFSINISLLVSHCNYSSILYHFRVSWR